MIRRLLALFTLAAAVAGPAAAADDYSDAERALFMTNHLAALRPPLALNYSYRRAGSLEEGFDDRVTVQLRAQPDGACCTASAEFLSGQRRLSLPEVEVAQGNPAILYFLERDIREMNRLTKGQQNYFRKRIRMAIFQGARIETVKVAYRGRSVDARRIVIDPYLDDPLRARFEQLAVKRYQFTLSDAVPGGVWGIRSQVDGAAGGKPLLVEEMLIDGASQP